MLYVGIKVAYIWNSVSKDMVLYVRHKDTELHFITRSTKKEKMIWESVFIVNKKLIWLLNTTS